MLKSEGFDRSKSSTIDTLSDLYIKFLNLLVIEVTKLAQARIDVDDTIALQDITQAFTNLGLIKPNDLLDVYDENPDIPNDKGAKALKNWCLNNIQLNNARKVALPNINLLKIVTENQQQQQQQQQFQKPQTTTTSSFNSKIGSNTTNNNEGLLPINHTQPQKQIFAVPGYSNPSQQNQQEELAKEKEEENNLIEELINNGDTDDWIRLLIVRQKLKIYNRRRLIENENSSSTSTSYTHSAATQNPDIPTIPSANSLPNIAGLKYSILQNTLQSSSMDTEKDTIPREDDDIKTNNESIPLITEEDIESEENVNNTTGVTMDSEIAPISNETASMINKVSLLTKLLPIMKPETKLDNISLSYDDFDVDNIEINEGTTFEKVTDDINPYSHMHNDDEDDPMGGSGNMQLGSTSNNINFDEFGDMDDTFQRRASLDYGGSSIF